MEPRLAFFDIAGTLVSGNPWRGFLKYDGIDKTRLYMAYPRFLPFWWAKNLKIIPDSYFRQVWIREMARLLQGMSRDDVQLMFHWIVASHMRDAFRDDVVLRLKEHKANGDYVILVSGMFTELTQEFATYLGADAAVGTQLGFDESGLCNGKIVGEGCAGQLKADFLTQYVIKQGFSLDSHETFAYADSYSDIPLLSLANNAIVTYPDDGLVAVAQQKDWEIIGQ